METITATTSDVKGDLFESYRSSNGFERLTTGWLGFSCYDNSRDASLVVMHDADSLTTRNANASFLFDYLAAFGIHIPDTGAVSIFLQDRPSISSNLYKLSEVLDPFRDNSEFSLEVVRKNEDGNELASLVLTIITSGDVDDVVEKLNEVEGTWLSSIADPDMADFRFDIKFRL